MATEYTVRNLEYLITKVENRETYWKELGLNIDYLIEVKFKDLNIYFEADIRKLKKSHLLEVSEFLLINTGITKTDDVEKVLEAAISVDMKTLYLLIREFTLRKKKTIQEYVKYKGTKIDHTTEIALIWALYNETPAHLFEIVTYHHWRNRSTNKLYTFSEKQNINNVLKIAQNDKLSNELCTALYKESNHENEYKIFSYAKFGETVIFQLYKKVNDKTVPDFVSPIRNREVKSVMFSIDNDKNYAEIRDYTKKEKDVVIDFLSKMFKCTLSEVKKIPFVNYQSEYLRETLLGVNHKEFPIGELLISAMTFNRSKLPKSPLLHFELEDSDVMEAVYHANQNGIVNLEDLKDIKSFKLRTAETSRLIRAVPLDSGDVVFSLDDGNLEPKTKKVLEEKFEERFSIPLNQPISNLNFNGDMEEKVDYLLGLSKETFLDSKTAKKLDELIRHKIIKKSKDKTFYCPVCGEDYDQAITECEECEVDIKCRSNISFQVNKDKAINYFENKISGFLASQWTELKKREITILDEKYKLLAINNEETCEEVRFLITDKQLPLSAIKKINRIVIPTVIVYIGSNKAILERYNDNCVMTKNYGYFYTLEDKESFTEYMDSVEEEFLNRRKQLSAKSGLEALKSLQQIADDKGYTDKDFEYDVFAVINDITHNCVQWGAKYSGKILPEGAFTLGYKINNEIGKFAYTYDCKLTGKDKGYGLDISEHRKASQYIRNMRDSDFLSDYLNNSLEISTHLIISNNVDIKKISSMNNHLKLDGIKSRVKLVSVEAFSRIYELYLLNYPAIASKPNHFKKTLNTLINKDKEELLVEDVEKEFKRLLKEGLMEQPSLDMEELTNEMLAATDINELQIKG